MRQCQQPGGEREDQRWSGLLCRSVVGLHKTWQMGGGGGGGVCGRGNFTVMVVVTSTFSVLVFSQGIRTLTKSNKMIHYPLVLQTA